METRRRLGLWRVAATIVPLLAVAFGSFFVGGTSVADAATSGWFSLGCSVSKSGGVTTVTMKFTVKAKATNSDTLAKVTFDVDGPAPTPDHEVFNKGSSYTSGPITLVSPAGGGTWPVTLKINDVVVRTGTATVTFTSGGASCKLTSP